MRFEMIFIREQKMMMSGGAFAWNPAIRLISLDPNIDLPSCSCINFKEIALDCVFKVCTFLPVAQRRGQVMLMVFQSLSFFVTFDLFNLCCRILQTDFTLSR